MNSHFRLAIAFTCLLITQLLAGDSTFVINQWLVTGPLELPNPLFADSSLKPERAIDQLDFKFQDSGPTNGQTFTWSPIDQGKWEQQSTDSLKFNVGGMTPFVLYAATYVESYKRQELPLTIRAGRPVAAWLDGTLIGKATKAKDNVYELSEQCDLHIGKHLLIVKLACEDDLSPLKIGLRAKFQWSTPDVNFLSVSTDPRRLPTHFADWARFEGVTSPAISSDGSMAAVVRNKRDEKYKLISWIEVYSLQPIALKTTLRTPASPAALYFMPNSPVLTYKQGGDNGTSIWGYNTLTGETKELLSATENLDELLVSPDGKFFYYFQDEDEKENKTGYEMFDEIEDRVHDFSRRRRIVEYSIESGTHRPLNEIASFAVNEMALSREGRKLAFTRYVPRTGRPYYDTELWVYDIQSRQGQLVTTLQLTESIDNMTWLPGEKQILYTAGSHASLPTDTVFHNVNHHPLFRIDISNGKVTNLSADAIWSIAEGNNNIYVRDNGDILLVVNLQGKVQILQSKANGPFQAVQTANPYVEQLRVAENGDRMLYAAARLDRPTALWTYDLSTKSERVVLDPNTDLLASLQVTSYEDWTFTNSDGYEIDGWVMKPSNFDPQKKYPLIVYYYGGVSPRDEKFSFTYQWWCANGYVVYILNPRGCVGYGQEFADFHSNDWGTAATQDVIEGTTKLLAENSYLDPKKIGAYGGSYGGFITLDLATKTEMFTALVDMYGISNIASYFGGGTWGYWYGDLALPGSLPWKNKDIFVEKSPLYHADKIKTPMLILHGGADNNVPPNESDQMFMALKILGQDVAYVKFDDESHNIINKFENLISHREMMLEWFDKYLKGQPAGWEKRWKE